MTLPLCKKTFPVERRRNTCVASCSGQTYGNNSTNKSRAVRESNCSEDCKNAQWPSARPLCSMWDKAFYKETVRTQLAHTEGNGSFILNLNSGLLTYSGYVAGAEHFWDPGKLSAISVWESCATGPFHPISLQAKRTSQTKILGRLRWWALASLRMGGVGSHKKTSHVKTWLNSTHGCFEGGSSQELEAKEESKDAENYKPGRRHRKREEEMLSLGCQCVSFRLEDYHLLPS